MWYQIVTACILTLLSSAGTDSMIVGLTIPKDSTISSRLGHSAMAEPCAMKACSSQVYGNKR